MEDAIADGYVALRCKREGDLILDSGEVIKVKEMPLGEWLSFITRQGTIMTDAKTLAITLLALPHLISLGLLDLTQKKI